MGKVLLVLSIVLSLYEIAVRFARKKPDTPKDKDNEL